MESTRSKPPSWTEKEGIIYFSLRSHGVTGQEWTKNPAFHLNNETRSTLCSRDFKSSSNVDYEVAVIKGSFFKKTRIMGSQIQETAHSLGFKKPKDELACLIRDGFSDQEIIKMGVTKLIVMHKPIFLPTLVKHVQNPHILGVVVNNRNFSLYSYLYDAHGFWDKDCGFVYEVSQEQTF